MSIQAKDESGIVHAQKWANVTKCRRRTFFRVSCWLEKWRVTLEEVSCMACIVSDEPSFRDGA